MKKEIIRADSNNHPNKLFYTIITECYDKLARR